METRKGNTKKDQRGGRIELSETMDQPRGVWLTTCENTCFGKEKAAHFTPRGEEVMAGRKGHY